MPWVIGAGRASLRGGRTAGRPSDPARYGAPVAPPVTLGHVGPSSLAATVYGLVDRGSKLRPQLAEELVGRIVIAFVDEGYADVLVDCRPDEIHIADHDGDAGADLQIRAGLADFNLLVSAPLAAGLPKPTDRRGRAALARMADGRVDFRGSIRLARRFLRLLSVAPARDGRAP
jgi:hypothetical protein